MIHFVVRNAVRWGIDDYLEYWGKPMATSVGTVSYEELQTRRELPRGSYIFTQKDELVPAELEMAAAVWDQLAPDSGVRLLNDPRLLLGRYDLLSTLHSMGLNRFKAVRATEDMSGLNFPVFVREERWHTGGLTELIHGPEELRRALGSLLIRGWRRKDLLVVEFLDTSDDQGLYRKYSAFVVGDAIISRSIQENTHWMVKAGYRDVDEERAREEMQYIESNPHGAWLREIADTARVDFGRIDYALMGDRPQAWEINLYPTLVRPSWMPRTTSDHVRELRKAGKTLFFQKLEEALRAIDTHAEGETTVKISGVEALNRRIILEQRRERWGTLHRRVTQRLSGSRVLRPLWRLIRPLASRVWRPSAAAGPVSIVAC